MRFQQPLPRLFPSHIHRKPSFTAMTDVTDMLQGSQVGMVRHKVVPRNLARKANDCRRNTRLRWHSASVHTMKTKVYNHNIQNVVRMAREIPCRPAFVDAIAGSHKLSRL